MVMLPKEKEVYHSFKNGPRPTNSPHPVSSTAYRLVWVLPKEYNDVDKLGKRIPNSYNVVKEWPQA